jgi:hypothetical protein
VDTENGLTPVDVGEALSRRHTPIDVCAIPEFIRIGLPEVAATMNVTKQVIIKTNISINPESGLLHLILVLDSTAIKAQDSACSSVQSTTTKIFLARLHTVSFGSKIELNCR